MGVSSERLDTESTTMRLRRGGEGLETDSTTLRLKRDGGKDETLSPPP